VLLNQSKLWTLVQVNLLTIVLNGYIRGKKIKQHGLATLDQNLQDLLSPWIHLRPRVYQMSKQEIISCAFFGAAT
jgi:hypothetical protein